LTASGNVIRAKHEDTKRNISQKRSTTQKDAKDRKGRKERKEEIFNIVRIEIYTICCPTRLALFMTQKVFTLAFSSCLRAFVFRFSDEPDRLFSDLDLDGILQSLYSRPTLQCSVCVFS